MAENPLLRTFQLTKFIINYLGKHCFCCLILVWKFPFSLKPNLIMGFLQDPILAYLLSVNVFYFIHFIHSMSK